VIRSSTSASQIEEILADADIEVEAAGVEAARWLLPLTSARGIDAIVCSCAALVDDELVQTVLRGTGRVIVPAGGFRRHRTSASLSAWPRLGSTTCGFKSSPIPIRRERVIRSGSAPQSGTMKFR
jgi:hypothetical protein